jgi:hypothetical protein
MKKTILTATALVFFFAPYLALAATCSLKSPFDVTSLQGPLVTCTGNYLTGATNSCQDLGNLTCTVATDIYFGMAFVIWIILPISFVSGGIMYMFGGANPGMLDKAKKTLWGAVIGAIIVLAAYALIATFVQFLNISDIGGFSSGTTIQTN